MFPRKTPSFVRQIVIQQYIWGFEKVLETHSFI